MDRGLVQGDLMFRGLSLFPQFRREVSVAMRFNEAAKILRRTSG